jgi:hypothetical protein
MKRKRVRDGFRPPTIDPDVVKAQKKAAEEARRHVTRQEMDREVGLIQTKIRTFLGFVNDYKIRVEALIKTLMDAGLTREEDFQHNFEGVHRLQSQLAKVSVQPGLTMRDKVEQLILYNAGCEPAFRVTEGYFSLRPWLSANMDPVSPEDTIRIAEAWEYTQTQIENLLVEQIVSEEARAENKALGKPEDPNRVGQAGMGRA